MPDVFKFPSSYIFAVQLSTSIVDSSHLLRATDDRKQFQCSKIPFNKGGGEPPVFNNKTRPLFLESN